MTTENNINNPNFGLFSSDETAVDSLVGVVDIYTEESHNLSVSKTRYPIESDENNQRMRSDNFVVEPEQLILKGLVSDLQPLSGGIVSLSSSERSKEAWGRIKELKNTGTFLTATTVLGVYENMLITNIDALVNLDTGDALSFTMLLEETLFSETELVQLAPAKLDGPAATKGTDSEGGLKQSEVPNNSETTFLQDAIEVISGWFSGGE